jgi:hypothetical protein
VSAASRHRARRITVGGRRSSRGRAESTDDRRASDGGLRLAGNRER